MNVTLDEIGKYITNGKHKFEVVDSVPPGYHIWNIGKNMIDGYLPLCRLKHPQPFEGCMEIETETLKAIKIDEAQIILAAVGGGQNTPEKMKRYIKRYGNAKPGTFGRRQAERMQKALTYMRKIKWN